MSVGVTGIASAQARVAQIQSLFGAPAAAPATVAAGANTASFPSSFGAAMDRAASDAAGQPPAISAPRTPAIAAFERKIPALPAIAAQAATHTPTSSPVSAAGRATATATSNTTSDANVDGVLATAKKYLGIPYKWGGTNPAVGLDCSGFVQLVMKQHGISLPRVSQAQARAGTKVESISQARPGDLVAFGSPVHHIGIYVGDGKMIHAPRTGDVVKISKVHKNLTAIRRVLPDTAAAGSTLNAMKDASAMRASQPAAQVANLAQAMAASVAGTATPNPQGGVIDPSAASSTMTLASALRAAALSPAVSSGDGMPAPDTWDAAVANAIAHMPTAEGGLGGVGGLGGIGGLGGGLVAHNDLIAGASAAANPVSLASPASGGSALNAAPAQFRTLFVEAERKYGVPANLLAAVAKQESDFTPTAVSHAGARGLMQLMPGTARGLGVRDAFDPAQAVDGAARLLRSHLRAFGSTKLALAAYNAGAGAVRKYDGVPPYRETQNYVRKIMSNISGSAA